MEWKTSLKILSEEGIGNSLTYLNSRQSSVTTSWGVDWSETYIARDIMQNFFDANRDCIEKVRVKTEGKKVTITAPTPFELERLFYLGSEKGDGDIGQYGEGFKVAAVCLLRDHRIEPIVLSGNSVVYLRIASEKVSGTELQPVIYDFFHSSEILEGTSVILRGCSKDLIRALETGLTHFFYDSNPLLGAKIWSSWDEFFSIYQANSSQGHIFYRKLKRGEIPDIPLVLVIDKKYEAIEKKIQHDRDRNAFGDELMRKFYRIFARGPVKGNHAGQQIIVAAAKPCWVVGHPLLSEIADADFHDRWSNSTANKIFGAGYYARSTTQEPAQLLEYNDLEALWRSKGRQPLPGYFGKFGVLNARDYCQDLRRRALEEAKKKHHRNPTVAESKAIELLTEIVRELAPGIMAMFARHTTAYSVAETEVVLGELKQKRSYHSHVGAHQSEPTCAHLNGTFRWEEVFISK